MKTLHFLTTAQKRKKDESSYWVDKGGGIKKEGISSTFSKFTEVKSENPVEILACNNAEKEKEKSWYAFNITDPNKTVISFIMEMKK